MPNDANRKALEARLQEVFGGYGLHALAVKGADLHLSIGDLARKLADLGVLVPSALTDEQSVGLRGPTPTHEKWGNSAIYEEVAQDMRAKLERIAKGEG